jgi:hypothetical protein
LLDCLSRVPYDGDTIDVAIGDRMYQVSDTVLLNGSIMTRFGFRVGEVSLVILKL